jgi:uncharacterized protein (UPF0335 family)
MKYNQITVHNDSDDCYWFDTYSDESDASNWIAADSLHEAIENVISYLELDLVTTDFVLNQDGLAIWKAPTTELKNIVESIEASIANIARLEATIQEINTEMAEILDLMQKLKGNEDASTKQT